MSKILEDKNEKQIGKFFPSMSSRQQVLYLMNKTNKQTDWNPDDKSVEVELMDYRKYFFDKKEKKRSSLSKHILDERCKLIKQSMKEFAHIKKNIYIDRKKYAFSDDEAYVCSCEKHPFKQTELAEVKLPFDPKKEDGTFGCGKSCLNKMVSWECVEHLCPAGVSCRNRRFQQHLYEEVYPVKTESRGWGLCAGEFLPKGTFVMQYIGEIYSIDSHYGQGKLKEYRNKTCTYLMSISKNEVIDPTFKGNLARFINHSCEPNCETQKWHVLGEICVGIFTLRDIQEGEEFTFNYGFDILKTTYQKCLCGVKSCKGYLGVVTNNELSKGLVGSILCDVCKNGCRGKETIVVCDGCKKIFHKNCVKRTKERKILESIKNYDPTSNSYLCNSCIKRKDRDNVVNSASIGYIKKDTNSINVINGLNNLSLSSQIIEVKDKYRDKKSSQELITELKKKKLKKGVLPAESCPVGSMNTNQTLNAIQEEAASISDSSELETENKEEPNTGLNSIKVDGAYTNPSNVIYLNDNSSVGASSNKIKTVRTFEEEEINDVTIEVSEMDIKKIQTSLKTLCNIGARLFWDFRQLSNIDLNNLIEVKITGTQTQINKVRVEINKIVAEKQVTLDSYRAEINVPKLFVRKIIGHQNRNLISYKSKFNVDIEYDHNLITDDIFQIGENSKITIKGKENFVKFVEKEIKLVISNLKTFTIFLMPTDYNHVRNNICQLKTMVDPADFRLRKRDYKIDRDIKHSFFYVPSNYKDLVIIGYDNELKKAEKILKEYLLRQNTLNVNTSLCFLCPLYYSHLIDNFLTDYSTLMQTKNMIMKVFDPVFSRKHLNIYLEGKWKDILEMKEMIFKYLNEKDKNKARGKSNITDFEQYAFNQEHKLISKNLRKYFLESDYMVKNWDLISEDIWQTIDGAKGESKQKKEKDEYSRLIKEFTRSSDRDTTMNYLLHLPSGSYNSVFSMSKSELSRSLINYVGDSLESYQSHLKDKGDRKEKSEAKFDHKQENEINNFKETEIVFETKQDEFNSINPKPNNTIKITNDYELIENLSDSEGEKEIAKEDNEMKIDHNGYVNSGIKYQSPENLDKFPAVNNSVKTFQNSLGNYNQKLQSNEGNNVFNTLPVSFADTSQIPKDNYIQVSNIINTLSVPDDKNLNSIQIDKNKISLNNQMFNPTISAIDNIQSTLLNKLNEIRNENKSNNEITNINSNHSVKSNDSTKNKSTLPNYGIVMQDDLNILKSLKNSQNTQNASISNVINPSEIMNISYNFSNINQMNININISSIKDLMKEQSINPHQKSGGESTAQGNQQNEMSILHRDNEKESVLSIEENIGKYDKYSERYREKEYHYLKRKFKPSQAIESKNTRVSQYNRTYDRERNFNNERDKDRVSSNTNNDYGYYNKADNTSTSRYAMNRRYYNPTTSTSNFSNYNYSRNPRTNYFNNNSVNKPFNKSSNFSNKRDRARYSRSKSSDAFSSRSHSISCGEEKSDSYSTKNLKSKYNERKRNTGQSLSMNIMCKENEASLKSKKEIGVVNSSASSQSHSKSNSMRSSSSSSSYSSSTSRSFKREQERDYTQTAYKFHNRNRGGIMTTNSYKQGCHNRKINYTGNYNKPIQNQNFRPNYQSPSINEHNSSNNYNSGHYYSNPSVNNKFYYDNNKSFNRSAYYKPNSAQKFNYSNGKYYNNYPNRYNRYTPRSRSASRSQSKDKYKEFLRLKKKESENLVERENVTEFDISNIHVVTHEVIQLKSCLRKPNNFN